MRIKVSAVIEQESILDIPNYVKTDTESIEEYLVTTYYGFDDEEEGEKTFSFNQIKILQKNA